MKISCALATYNGAEFIEEQLDSILTQTVPVDELIVSDDRSYDDTLTIIEKVLSKSHINFSIIRNKEKLGCYRNFENAITYSSGDIIFLSDQDDIWFPNKVEIHLKHHLDRKDILAVTNNCLISDKNFNTFGNTKLDNLKLLGKNYKSFVMGCCCSIKKNFLNAALPFPDSFSGHDNWLCELADYAEKRIFIEDTLQLYRQHDSNDSTYLANNPRGITTFVKINFLLERVYGLFLKNSSQTKEELFFNRMQKIK